MSKTDFNGKTTTYAYETNNRLLTKTPDASFNAQPISFTYFANGLRKTFAYPNGVATNYAYDTLNRLKQVGAQAQSAQLSNYAYTLGAAGNRLTVAELSGRTVNYGYDALYRLTSETVGGWPTLFASFTRTLVEGAPPFAMFEGWDSGSNHNLFTRGKVRHVSKCFDNSRRNNGWIPSRPLKTAKGGAPSVW